MHFYYLIASHLFLFLTIEFGVLALFNLLFSKKSFGFRWYAYMILFAISLSFTLMRFGAERKDSLFILHEEGLSYKFLELPSKAADTIYVYVKDDGVNDTVKAKAPTVETPKNAVIPFTEKNGVKYIKIKVGDLTFDAIYDTGCGFPISFTPKAYYKMVGAGLIEEEKFTGRDIATIADGSEHYEYHFVLPEFKIGDLIFSNQSVSLSENGSEILVGNPLFKTYGKYTIDNKNKCLIFN